MKRELVVHVVNLIRLLQEGFAYAAQHNDAFMSNLCDCVFSALMSRDIRQSHVELPANPCERNIRVIMRTVGTGDEEWLRKII